jgi:Polysaccharide pyruvyl transferase
MRMLVAGWFSFEMMGASAGDLFARDVVCGWLESAGHTYEVAVAPPFTGGVDWRIADPAAFDTVLFVCGPVGNAPPLTDLLARFAACRLVAVDVSLLQSPEEWNPFDVLYERDSELRSRPDLSLAAPPILVPLAGLLLIDTQPEYGTRDRHDQANAAIGRLIESRSVAVIPIDTRLDVNATGLRTAAEVESLIARMDLVLTTRLHGLALSIKHGVPAIAIDPVAGGAKLRRQAAALGWPMIFDAETVTDRQLQDAFDYCGTHAARAKAAACRLSAIQTIEQLRKQVLESLSHLDVARSS